MPIVTIEMFPGRNLGLKMSLMREIRDVIAKRLNVSTKVITIKIQETLKQNFLDGSLQHSSNGNRKTY